MVDLIERARFLASGQDDPHSVTIDELCDEVERLRSAASMTLDLLQKRHASASYAEDVDAAERFLKYQITPSDLKAATTKHTTPAAMIR